MSTAEKAGNYKTMPERSRLSDPAQRGDPQGGQTRKNRLRCEASAGVRNRESGDHIKGCDGTCVHAGGSLAGVGG